MTATPSRGDRPRQGSHPCRGVVAGGHPGVCDAAAAVLHSGGNAFDAAIAAGFAAAVGEPGLTSLGGGGFLLARSADGRERIFDFFVDTAGRGHRAAELEPHLHPFTVRFSGAEQVFNAGRGSVAVPGNLKGFLHVHASLGRLPLARVLEPAVRMAREGVALNRHQAHVLKLLEPILTASARGRSLYAPEGRLPREGECLVNAELADFMEGLPKQGGRDFYQGELAARIAAEMREGQGLLTQADLAAYQVFERSPLCVEYRGHRLLTNPPPSFGGSLIGLSLELLSRHDLAPLGWGSAEHLELLASVMREVDRRRVRDAAGEARRRTSRGTTHASVADAEGNVASLSTSNGEGSGYLVPGTGIMLNNMLGEDDLHPEGFHASPPGQRVGSMMSPMVVVGTDGVRLILGSGGSKRIRTALLQVVSNVLDFGMPVREAVAAPRVHWDGERLQVEPGFQPEAVGALGAEWRSNLWTETDLYFGGVHAVDPAGEGAGDPRRGGSARVID